MLGAAYVDFEGFHSPAVAKPEKRKFTPGIGSVSRLDARAIFVPGSIANATKSGKEFSGFWEELMGEPIAYVNSNMPISDYPGQFIRSPYAKRRDDLVEDGVCNFIRSCESDEVEVIGHSAGTAQALRAALKYKEAGGEKTVRVFLMGGGSPGVKLSPIIRRLSEIGVLVENIVDRYDVVPRLAGSSMEKLARREVTGEKAVTKKQKALNLLKFVVSPTSPHKQRNYVRALALRVESRRAAIKVESLLDQAFGAETAPVGVRKKTERRRSR